MLAAALLIATFPNWVPARWPFGDVRSLDLLKNTPINCLWIERPNWSLALAQEAADRGIVTLGVIHREGDPIAAAQELVKAHFNGAVIEGAFDDYSMLIISGTLAKAKMTVIESGTRTHMRLDGDSPVLSTSQGMWPGIHIEKGNTSSAGPTANPWIDTNTGFLRFIRRATNATLWVAVQPNEKTVYPVSRYLQAIGDAAINGARWVVSLDADLQKRLAARDRGATEDWAKIAAALRHYEEHAEWREATPAGEVVIAEDLAGARLSGGVLDMLAAKQVPMFPVPRAEAARFTAAGKRVYDGPAVAPAPEETYTSDPKDTRADAVWRKISDDIGRQNVGVRLFNVPGMLSNIVELHGARQKILHLVNYSDFPASGITARVLGNYQHARLYRPGEPPVDLETEKSPEGTSFAIDYRVTTIATVVLE